MNFIDLSLLTVLSTPAGALGCDLARKNINVFFSEPSAIYSSHLTPAFTLVFKNRIELQID